MGSIATIPGELALPRRRTVRSVLSLVAGGALLAAECLGTAARGEIAFDPRTRSVLVTGFPADRPATLEDLRAADRAGKWGIVQHRQTTETTTLDAGLRIGQSDGTSSFLRIGCREQPSETLVVKGDVWIRSPREKSYATYEGQNGLLLGVEGGGAVSDRAQPG